jgi:hypothetical protein
VLFEGARHSTSQLRVGYDLIPQDSLSKGRIVQGAAFTALNIRQHIGSVSRRISTGFTVRFIALQHSKSQGDACKAGTENPIDGEFV